MKKLVLIRHAYYNSSGHLDEEGRRDMELLAHRIMPYLQGLSTWIITSTLSRALESAQVLGDKLISPIDQSEALLLCEGHSRINLLGIMDLVKSKESEVDVLLLVTSREYVDLFPDYYGQQEWGVSLGQVKADCATGFLIDCETKSLRQV